MLKIGILGMGGMGWYHARRYPNVPNAQIVAIADLVPERLEAKEAMSVNLADEKATLDLSQAARYGEAADLIAQADVDVVDICLPTDLHAPYAIKALEAGLHVLCEKPMALTSADAEWMIATSKATGRKLMIAHCLRFWPEYLYLKRCIQDQPYGRLLSLNMWRMGGHPGWAAESWFADPARSGGMVLDLHIHDVDYVNAVLGRPERIYATARTSEQAKAYDVLHAIFEYTDGPQIHMHAGWSVGQIPFQAGFEAWFDRAFVRFDEGKLTVFDDPGKVSARPAEFEPGDAYLNEIAYFMHCVETDTPPVECLPESVKESIALIEREYQVVGH